MIDIELGLKILLAIYIIIGGAYGMYTYYWFIFKHKAIQYEPKLSYTAQNVILIMLIIWPYWLYNGVSEKILEHLKMGVN